MASYNKLSKDNWQVVVSLGYGLDGKKDRVKKQGFKLKGDAEKYVTDLLTKKGHGYIIDCSSNILFKDFVLEWFEDYKSISLAISTRACYIGRINKHIIPLLGHYKLSEISNTIIQRFYNTLIKNNMKPSAAKKIFDILTGCFKYAKKQKLIYEMPTDIDKLKPATPKVKYWSKEEANYFLEYMKGSYLLTPILTAVLTGLRVGEICGLRWCDIDFDKSTLSVNNQVVCDVLEKKIVFTSVLKTATSYRKITIPNLLLEHFKSIKAEVNATNKDFIVLDSNGLMSSPKNLSMNFNRYVSKFKDTLDDKLNDNSNNDYSNYMQLKQISFHGLRHTHATLLIFYGENAKVVSDRLGHKDVTVTLNAYTHVMSKMKQNTAMLLDDIFDKDKNKDDD